MKASAGNEPFFSALLNPLQERESSRTQPGVSILILIHNFVGENKVSLDGVNEYRLEA
jgi:hypothetical protein